jgi:uncharacterized membrane protein
MGAYVAAVHVNTEALVVLLVLLALYLAEKRGSWFLAGLALGTSSSIKLTAILIAPLWLVKAPREERTRVAAGIALGCVPIALAAVIIGEPFIKCVLLYAPAFAVSWGFQHIPIYFAHGDIARIQRNVEAFRSYGTLALGLVMLAWCFSRAAARRPLIRAAGVVYYLLLFFAPGFGAQYLIYPVPFLLLSDVPLAVLYSLAAAVFTIPPLLFPSELGLSVSIVGGFAAWILSGFALKEELWDRRGWGATASPQTPPP